jgi:hypothetical protein
MRSGKFDDAGNFAHLAGMNQFRWLMINCVKSRDLFRDGELSPTGRGPSSGDVPWRGTKIFLLTFNSADLTSKAASKHMQKEGGVIFNPLA